MVIDHGFRQKNARVWQAASRLYFSRFPAEDKTHALKNYLNNLNCQIINQKNDTSNQIVI